jgi:hypothetical protein
MNAILNGALVSRCILQSVLGEIGLEEAATAQEKSNTAPARTLHRDSTQPGMEHRLRRRSVARWQALPALTILDVYTREGLPSKLARA